MSVKEDLSIQVRRSNERGHAEHGWLESYHTFSFADYHDQRFMGFRQLRVINEDWIEPGQGFGTHPHRDMEIITFILEGALEHKDSMGNGSIIRPGDIQVMSAGTGVSHSEFNHSKKDPVHLLQIWIVPAQRGLKPTYQQKSFSEEQRRGNLCTIVSGNDVPGTTKIHQDIELFTAILSKDERVKYRLKPTRHAWIQIIRGSLGVNGLSLQAGDAVAISNTAANEKDLDLLVIDAANGAEFLLFNIA